MIGKAIIGNNFRACINYCLNEKKSPKILGAMGVYGKSVDELTNQFELIASQRPNLNKAVWHGAISFAYDDDVSDELMLKIAKGYLDGLGLNDNQYLIVKHCDTKHEHLHLIINRVRFDEEVSRDFRCGYKAKKVMQGLEKEYGLTVATEQGNKRKLSIENQIEVGLLNKESIDQIFNRIENIGFTIVYNKTSKGVIRGISFRDNDKGIIFKSSSIKREYSYFKLLKLTQKKSKGRSKSLSISL